MASRLIHCSRLSHACCGLVQLNLPCQMPVTFCCREARRLVRVSFRPALYDEGLYKVAVPSVSLSRSSSSRLKRSSACMMPGTLMGPKPAGTRPELRTA